MSVVLGIIILILMIVIGVSIPFAFGATLIYYYMIMGGSPATTISVGFSQLNSLVLLAIPMFVIAGGIIEKGQLGDALVGFIDMFIGHIKGGLGAVSVVTCAVFGAITGSCAATLSCIGSVMMPKLRKAGYDDGFATALLVNAAPLGLLIPPSADQILYAWSAGESVLACFLSTIIPGCILAFLLCVINFVYARKSTTIVVQEKVHVLSAQGFGRFRHGVPALLFPVIILGGIYGGIMTPTEAASVSIIYAIPVGIYIYKGMKWRDLKNIFIETGTTTGVIMVMLFVIMIVSRYFVMADIPNMMKDAMLSISDNKYVILLMCNIFMVIIGMLMDDVSGMLLCTPLLLPLMKEIGISPIHFAAIIGVNLGMGNITPPTAPLLYLGCRLTGAKLTDVMKPTLTMLFGAWLPTLLLTTYVPSVALFLPRLFGYAV
ncbi:MAG: TRAP transporter large permease [Clostridiales bacterium]|nr:TRAP transporter large permease [Clostridiales bacterium]